MSQPSKKKRKLPKNITERPDSEAVELVLGKRIKKALDKAIQDVNKKFDPESINT